MRVLMMSLAAMLSACAADGRVAAPTAAAPAFAPASASAQGWVDELLATDRAFAVSALEDGLAALGQMFDDDVVMFAVPVPGFSRGRANATATLATALGAENVSLDWTAIRGGISADGQHGFTFGYVTTHSEGAADQLSKYLAYWVRRPEGWRVALYKLAPRPEGDVSLALMPASLPARQTDIVSDAGAHEGHRASLAAREQQFSDRSTEIGLGPAFVEFGRDDAINLGGGPEFVLGAANIGETQPGGPGSPVIWSADQGVIVASSGDLGATWGYLHRTGPTPPGRLAVIPFFTIWRRDNPNSPWLYVAE